MYKNYIILLMMAFFFKSCIENHFNVAKNLSYFDVEEKIELGRYLGKFIGFILPSALALDFGVELIKVIKFGFILYAKRTFIIMSVS